MTTKGENSGLPSQKKHITAASQLS